MFVGACQVHNKKKKKKKTEKESVVGLWSYLEDLMLTSYVTLDKSSKCNGPQFPQL